MCVLGATPIELRAACAESPVRRRDLAGYEREANRLFRRFRRFVYGFYDPVLFEAFCTDAPFDAIRAAVTTILAGGVEEVPLSTRLWTRMMFVGIGFDRLRRRLGLGPTETPEAGGHKSSA